MTMEMVAFIVIDTPQTTSGAHEYSAVLHFSG